MSRRIEDLHLAMQPRVRRWLAACKDAGLDILVTCTMRTWQEQAALYAQGRTTPGRIVTYARPGESAHNHGLALDFVPLAHGKPQWSATHPHWAVAGELGEAAGLEWAGRWTKFREYPHLQMPLWRTLIEEQAA
ncbi:MAG: peptidase M15 [Desulfurellales bacterium]|nr:MAG: peptidase M15 [Desulfurellales bacterium]